MIDEASSFGGAGRPKTHALDEFGVGVLVGSLGVSTPYGVRTTLRACSMRPCT